MLLLPIWALLYRAQHTPVSEPQIFISISYQTIITTLSHKSESTSTSFGICISISPSTLQPLVDDFDTYVRVQPPLLLSPCPFLASMDVLRFYCLGCICLWLLQIDVVIHYQPVVVAENAVDVQYFVLDATCFLKAKFVLDA